MAPRIFLLLVLAALPSGAADFRSAPFAATPAELIEAFEGVEPADGQIITTLYRDIRFSLGKRGKRTGTLHRIYRIDSTEAGMGGSIRANWQPWLEDRPKIEARVIGSDGVERRLDPGTLVESAAGQLAGLDIYSDVKLVEGPLPGVQKGAIVELLVETTNRRSALEAGVVEAIELYDGGPSLETLIEIEAPESMSLAWKAHGLPEVSPKQQSAKGRRKLRWSFGRLEQPDLMDLLASIDDLPRLEFSTGESWGAVAAEYSEIVDDQIAPVVGEWAEARGSARETAAALLEQVHERVRYTSVALGQASIVPRSPAETLERRYGDCKDKSTLMVALLRERGIAAHVALLNASGGPDADPDLPGFGAFDHAIVYVGGEDPFWTDPTIPYARAGELPVADQGRWALIASKDSSELIRTPLAEATANRFERRTIERLATRGKGERVDTDRYWGEFERNQRAMHAETDRERLEEARNEPFEGKRDVERYRIAVNSLTDAGDLAVPFEKVITTTAPVTTPFGLSVVTASFDGATVVLSGVPFGSGESDDAESDDEPAPLKLAYPYSALVEHEVSAPYGYRLRRLPRTIDVGELPQGASFQESFERISDESVRLRAELRIEKKEFGGDEAETLRAAVGKIRKRKAVQIFFDSVADLHLKAGRTRDAIELCRRALERDPDDGFHRLKLMRGYLAAGAGVEARREARIAVERAPDDAMALLTLGAALLRDRAGLPYRRGADFEEAEQAMRKSAELDGREGFADYSVRIALTYSPDGLRYGDPDRLERALAVAKKLAEKNRSLGARSAYADTLNWMGRHEEALEYLESVKIEGSMAAQLIQASAMVEGPEAALDRASQQASSSRDTYVRNAAARLVSTRNYSEAAALFRSIATGAAMSNRDSSDALLNWAEVYSQTVRHEELDLPEDDPKSVVIRWIAALHQRGDWLEAIKPLVSRFGKIELRSEYWAKAFDAFVTGSRYSREPEVSQLDRRIDEILTQARFEIEGDDEAGYVVRARWPNPWPSYSSRPLWFFVIREEDGLKILDTTEGYGRLADLGAAVVDRLDGGDLEGARQLLDWASEADYVSWGGYRQIWGGSLTKSESLARAAAAALMASGDESLVGRAVEILAVHRPEGDREAEVLERVLQGAYINLHRTEEALEMARRSLEGLPGNEQRLRAVTGLLVRMGRIDDAIALYDDAISADTDEVRFGEEGENERLGLRLSRAILAGDMAEAYHLAEELDALGGSGWAYWNNVSWISLVHGPVDERARRAADTAVKLSGGRVHGVLNTQAAIYAALGEPEQARKILLQSMAMGRRREMNSGDWYVNGLICEAFGLADSAVHSYRESVRTDRFGPERRAYDSPAALAVSKLLKLSNREP